MNLNVIAKDLFNKIRGQFPQVTLGDSGGQATTEPTEARFFDFDFKESGNTLGKVSISISEEDGLVVMHSKDFVEQSDEPLKHGWYNFLKELRSFAKARVLGFDTRDITKSNLEKRDYDFLGQGKEVETVSESNLYGTTKTSFQTVGEARLVIKHSAPVNPTVAGGRTHRIESLFIESNAGERFKYPVKHLNGARAMARHVSEGGNPFDDFGKHISEMSAELNQLRKFKTYMNRSNVMAEGLKQYQSVVDERIEEIKTSCLKLQKQNNYKESFESYSKSELAEVPEDVKKSWIDELTIKTFNEELQDVFPYIYKLVSERTAIEELGPTSFEAHGYQGGIEPRTLKYDLVGDFDPENPISDMEIDNVQNLLSKAGISADVQSDPANFQGVVVHTDTNPEEIEKVLGGMIETVDNFHEFESAMDDIVREDNGLFSQDADEQNLALEKLNTLMTKHFPVGVNGTNGIESLAGIIDDQELNAQIEKAANEDSDACMRPMILDYISQKDPTLVSKIETGDMNNEPKEEEDVAEGHYPHMKSFDKLYGIKDVQQYKAMADDAQSMDMEEFKDTYNSTIDMAGDFYQDHQKNEAITFEDIKPYVSMYKGDDGKMVYDILDKDEKSVTKFNNAKDAMEYLRKNFDKLKSSDSKIKNENETDYEGSMDYELSGDDGEMAHGTIHYKAIDGKVDPNSLKGEYTYDGNHKIDDDTADEMIKPGGAEHEEALKAAQEDYDFESDRMKSKMGAEDQEQHKGCGPDCADHGCDCEYGRAGKETKDKELSNKEETVEDFVKSFFDYTSNQFPKGETAVLTSVEKKFGDSAVATAQETIQNLMANKDPEIAKIKKLAGVQ